jgi:photosystem II stability/assembly factor-like uncharacterized protein
MMKKYIVSLILCLFSWQISGQWLAVEIPTKASFRALKSHGNHIWAGGTQGTVGHSTDAGKTWTFKQIPGTSSLDFRDLMIINNKEILFMSAGPSEEGKARIWRTSDGGETWHMLFEKTDPGYFFDCLQWDSKQKTGWLLADPIAQKISLFKITNMKFEELRTRDELQLQRNEAFFAASGSSLLVQGNKLVLVGGGGALARIYSREDKNASWRVSETAIQTGEAKGYFSIGAKNKSEYWTVGGDYRTLNESTIPILTTKDGGYHWDALENSPSFYMEKVIWTKPYWVVTGPSQSAAYHEKKKEWKSLGKSGFHNIIRVKDTLWGIGAKGQLGKISLSSIDQLFLSEK